MAVPGNLILKYEDGHVTAVSFCRRRVLAGRDPLVGAGVRPGSRRLRSRIWRLLRLWQRQETV